MTRLTQSTRRRVGQFSSKIANAAHHVIPHKMPSWKIALYLIVFLLPGGSFAVLGMGWFENRQRRRKTASASVKPKHASAHPLLATDCACVDGASGA
jgi:hypothetical protein